MDTYYVYVYTDPRNCGDYAQFGFISAGQAQHGAVRCLASTKVTSLRPTRRDMALSRCREDQDTSADD